MPDKHKKPGTCTCAPLPLYGASSSVTAVPSCRSKAVRALSSVRDSHRIRVIFSFRPLTRPSWPGFRIVVRVCACVHVCFSFDSRCSFQFRYTFLKFILLPSPPFLSLVSISMFLGLSISLFFLSPLHLSGEYLPFSFFLPFPFFVSVASLSGLRNPYFALNISSPAAWQQDERMLGGFLVDTCIIIYNPP